MALLPPHYPNAVVALETKQGSDPNISYQTVATGVLVGFQIDPEGTPAPQLAVYLVTNKHVVGDDTIWARFNTGQASDRFELRLRDPAGEPLWTEHPAYDVTVTTINTDALAARGAEFIIITDADLLTAKAMRDRGVAAGDDVFVLGFPMGLGGRERKYVVVRAGVIARLDEEIIADTQSYLIDCVTFPGNSGGPVVLRPTISAIEGTQAINKAYVVGIVSAYLPYIDTAISSQTNRPRVTFEENSGLTSVVPIDAIEELIQPKIAQLRLARQAAAAPTPDQIPPATGPPPTDPAPADSAPGTPDTPPTE